MDLAKGITILYLGFGVGPILSAAGYHTQKQAGFFEGSLRYVVSRYSSRSGKAIEREQVDILATANRLSIPSLDMADVFANNAPAGVSSALFRHDSDDFIIYGEDVDAYQFKGYDRILLMAFELGSLQSSGGLGKPSSMVLSRYEIFAMRSRYYGEEGMRYEGYLSKDYRVTWGALGESWLFGSGGLRVSELDSALKRGEVPVRVEVFRGKSKLLSVNLMAADEYRIADSLVALPAQNFTLFDHTAKAAGCGSDGTEQGHFIFESRRIEPIPLPASSTSYNSCRRVASTHDRFNTHCVGRLLGGRESLHLNFNFISSCLQDGKEDDR